jgi:hypothetical protein
VRLLPALLIRRRGLTGIILNLGADFKTPQFAQSLRQAHILILEILNVFLWLKYSPSLTLNKLKRFETGS